MENEIEAKNVDEQKTSSHREERLVMHLTMKQAEALTTIGAEWAKAKIGIPSVSLLALERRGLIEMRRVARGGYWANLPYSSGAYQWRLKSGHNVTTQAPL